MEWQKLVIVLRSKIEYWLKGWILELTEHLLRAMYWDKGVEENPCSHGVYILEGRDK